MDANRCRQALQRNNKIAWSKPSRGCYKLNVDASRIDRDNIATIIVSLEMEEGR